MNAQQEAVALFQYFEKRKIKVSVRSVGRILRGELKLRFRESDLRLWLSGFLETRQKRDASRVRPAEVNGTQQSLLPDASGTQPPDATGTRLRARHKVSLVSNTPTGGVETPQTAPKAVKPLPDWVLAVQRAAWATSKVRLSDLTAEQRFTVAQFHAFKFCNCASDQKRNAARAIKLAASLADLGESRDYGHFTVKEYVEGCGVVMQMTRQLVQSPWDFRASLEYGAAV